MEQREQQLCDFYEKHLEGASSPARRLRLIKQLLASYPFSDVVTVIRGKFGQVPPGWDLEGACILSHEENARMLAKSVVICMDERKAGAGGIGDEETGGGIFSQVARNGTALQLQLPSELQFLESHLSNVAIQGSLGCPSVLARFCDFGAYSHSHLHSHAQFDLSMNTKTHLPNASHFYDILLSR
jgi:hypothetical protein